MADADAVDDTPKVQLPLFTPPKFHWNQDNLYEQFKSFKWVVEFAFKGQYERCPNSVKCGSKLNWLGIEAYPVYDNLQLQMPRSKILSNCLLHLKNIS